MSITNVSMPAATTSNLLPGTVAPAGDTGTTQQGAGIAPKVAPITAPAAEKKSADRADVEVAVKHIEEFVHTAASNLNFSIDDQTGMTIVKVTDAKTNELIRQIPTDEILAIARAMDRFQGLLIESKA